jgi:hypothetical protein
MSKQRIRLWDANWQCVYDSDASDLTFDEYMELSSAAWVNATRDIGGTRWSGRVTRTPEGEWEWHRDDEYFKHIKAWVNPGLGGAS